MFNKLLVISGPTATGKTALAVKIAKRLGGAIISADSRQIYKEMDIGVGKDHPDGTPIYLIDLILPNTRFSVAQFRRLAIDKISFLQSQHILPIVVGCSGLYIDSIINPNYTTFSIKPNKLLRTLLNILPTVFLQKIYLLLDKNPLNNSDFNNPRRLVRKIEIKLSNHKNSPSLLREGVGGGFNILHISLTAPNKYLFSRIDERVKERLKSGHLTELKTLLTKYQWTDPGLQVSCYSVFKNNPYLQAIQLWKYAEHADARHQKSWFNNKYPSAIFYNISLPRQITQAIQQITKWYNNL